MCVDRLKRRKIPFTIKLSIAGGNGPLMSPLPTKLLMNWEDITTDHRDVPASEMNLHGDQQVFHLTCHLIELSNNDYFSTAS